MTDNNHVCKNTFFRSGGEDRFVNSEWGFSFSVWPPSFGFPISQEDDWKFPRQKQAEKPGGKLSYLSPFLPLSYIANRQTDRTELFSPWHPSTVGDIGRCFSPFPDTEEKEESSFVRLVYLSRQGDCREKRKRNTFSFPFAHKQTFEKGADALGISYSTYGYFFSNTLAFPLLHVILLWNSTAALPSSSLLLFENKNSPWPRQTENQSLLSPTTTTVCLSPFLSRPLCIMFSFPHIQNRLLTSSPSSSFLFSSFLSASFPSPFSPAPAALHKFAWKERARLLLRRRPLLPLPSLETHRGRRKRKEKDLLLQPPTYLPYPKDTTLLRAWDSTIVTKNRLGKYYIKLVAHICTKTTFFIWIRRFRDILPCHIRMWGKRR